MSAIGIIRKVHTWPKLCWIIILQNEQRPK